MIPEETKQITPLKEFLSQLQEPSSRFRRHEKTSQSLEAQEAEVFETEPQRGGSCTGRTLEMYGSLLGFSGCCYMCVTKETTKPGAAGGGRASLDLPGDKVCAPPTLTHRAAVEFVYSRPALCENVKGDLRAERD